MLPQTLCLALRLALCRQEMGGLISSNFGFPWYYSLSRLIPGYQGLNFQVAVLINIQRFSLFCWHSSQLKRSYSLSADSVDYLLPFEKHGVVSGFEE